MSLIGSAVTAIIHWRIIIKSFSIVREKTMAIDVGNISYGK